MLFLVLHNLISRKDGKVCISSYSSYVAKQLAYFLCVPAQSCLTLCDPTDCSQPGSSVHGVSQARVLEWGAISYSRDLPNPGIKPASLSSPWQADSLPLYHPGYFRHFTTLTFLKNIITVSLFLLGLFQNQNDTVETT